MLEINNLVKRYGKGAPVLKDLNLSVQGEQLMSIIGSSGAGKSTLLRCINRLVEPTSGTITLNGTEMTTLGPKDLRRARRRVGMVFQSFNLVDRLTVMENVQSGRLGYISTWAAVTRRYPAADIERAFELMERVGIAQYANKRADELSGGERQRVGVVRALMQRPEILLADEPTASLDPKTSEQIMSLLRDLANELNLPVIINIHNVTEAKEFSDRIVGMRYGRIIFDDKPAALDAAQMDEIYAGTPSQDRQDMGAAA
ncbi:phosphonate ABC transporter ATP-binding protein [Loktanella sp. 3ANDIMAR09]|uniref:phosphonate ABC transporter ATP-binding protein n=1 Tax=Loktanella sp. 3ANDIMAR09 TaxID=1225657 RepID=UPI0006FF7836|nr:phosphonate ABC transporter ATP-binding protein [Loktanella sp. 3ANDIMAR09]KQI68839.1 phosphonate ABC transporter ATP-binding protein [Loktanella sp. 3ANDIMAR09]